jgi:hypothetical protein
VAVDEPPFPACAKRPTKLARRDPMPKPQEKQMFFAVIYVKDN